MPLTSPTSMDPSYEEAMDLLRSYLGDVRIPDAATKIFKEECCISFDTPKASGGLLVDLSSYLAFGRDYVMWNYEKTGHGLYLCIRRTEKSPMEERPHKKPTLLAIGMEGGYEAKEVQYEDFYSLVLLPSFIELPYPNADLPEKVRVAVERVLTAEGAEKQQQLAAWVADRKAVSRYALELQQLDNGVVVPPGNWKCAHCDKRENLWLNLTDGTMLCGRRNWDGSGGNNHALQHYEATKYPLAVKLGTITSDLEAADVYSYPEDDAVVDPLLAQHLAHFGIDFSSLQKTEMTTAERELDQNLNFDWNRIQEAGKELQPLFGPGYTGLANLGNSCYMASVLQVLFSTKEFQQRYYHGLRLQDAFRSGPSDPTADLNIQMAKLGYGLLSGKYSVPTQGVVEAQTSKQQDQEGIPPRMFKSLIGRGHPEFSTSRQQDALEFYQHLLERLEQGHSRCPTEDPSRCFRFHVEERIQCGATGRVKYTRKTDNALSLPIPLTAAVNKEEVAAFEKLCREREAAGGKMGAEAVVRPRVPLQACLESLGASEEVPGFYSAAIQGTTTAIKSMRLATFPDYLVLHMRKFGLAEGWVPKKLDVFLDVPDDLDLGWLRSTGMQPGEELLPEGDAGGSEAAREAPAARPVAEEAIVVQLMDMGFPRGRCEKAAVSTANAGAEEAMTWLLAHMEDADIDDPLPAADSTKAAAVDEGHVSMLLAFGFSDTAARNGLRAMGGDVERAAEWIFSHPEDAEASAGASHEDSAPAPLAATATTAVVGEEDLPDGPGKYQLLAFVSHMGTNTQCGHYVCHIKKEGRWVLFNDAKVAASGDLPKDLGYLYIYKRIEA